MGSKVVPGVIFMLAIGLAYIAGYFATNHALLSVGFALAAIITVAVGIAYLFHIGD
jgi:hypothetical protein